MTPPIRMVSVPVDELAQEIRRVDGNHSLGAGALAEALLPFLSRLSAAPVREEGGAVDGPEDDELPGAFLARVGMDGALWADGFRKMALKLGYSDMDEGWLIGWFCNAVMAGYDHAQRRFDPALATREEAPAEAGERETLRVLLDNMVIAQSLSKELRQRATDEARSYLSALRAQPPAREDAQPVGWLRAVDEEMVCAHLGVADAEDSFETAKKKLASLIQWNIAVATDPSVGGHPVPDALRVAVEALEKAVWSLSSFGQLAQDDEGGNTEGLDDEVVVRMTFPDPEFGGEKTLLGELFIRAFRKARATTDEIRQALAALQAEQKGGA